MSPFRDDGPLPVQPQAPEASAPTEDGWYGYDQGSQTMIFRLTRGQWYAVLDNGESTPCEWGYIEQALSVFSLVPLMAEPSPVLNPPETLARLVDQWGAESIYDAFITRWPVDQPAPVVGDEAEGATTPAVSAGEPLGTVERVRAAVDAVLRVRFPATFEGDWRSKPCGPQTAAWQDDMEANAKQIVAAVAEALAAQDALAERVGALADVEVWAAWSPGRPPSYHWSEQDAKDSITYPTNLTWTRYHEGHSSAAGGYCRVTRLEMPALLAQPSTPASERSES